jgi:flagellar basal body-associated protein FliL
MEPSVRSMVNILLQQIPPEDVASINAQNTIKTEVRDFVNDTLDRLDFGDGLREGIGKRRVTDVLLPMFVAQYL